MKKTTLAIVASAALTMMSGAAMAQSVGEAPSVEQPAFLYLGADIYSGYKVGDADLSRFSLEFQNAGEVAYFTGAYSRYDSSGELNASINEARLGIGAHYHYDQGTMIFGDVNYLRRDYSVSSNTGFAPVLAEGKYDENGTLVRAGVKHRYAPGLEVGVMLTRLTGFGDNEHGYQAELRHYATERLSVGVLYEGHFGRAGKVDDVNYLPNQWIASVRYHF